MLKVVFAGMLAGTLMLAQQATLPDDATPTFRVETRVVEAYASVFDRHGNSLPNLTRERFQVLDDGKPQSLLAFEGSEDKVSCALLLDVTGSMDAFLPVLKNAVVKFVDEMRDKEEIGVYTFTTSLRLAQPFTTDKKLIKQAVLRTRAQGDTALFDAVSDVSRDLEARKGKKALILFTDGADNSSVLTAAGASRRARLSGVPIYAIAEGDALRDSKLVKTLEQLTSDSGGITFRLDKPDKIGEVFSAIVRDLRNTYLLSWKLPDDAGQAWRSIKIAVDGVKQVRIRARQGYFPK